MWGRQSLEQLAKSEGCSTKWAKRHLDAVKPRFPSVVPQPTVIGTDTTYWGRGYGVCVFRSPTLKRNLCWAEVEDETAATCAQSLHGLISRGWTITAAVIDGRRGIAKVFEAQGIPVQFCQFHQMRTVTKYLTRKPKTEAGRDLRRLVCALHHITHTSFTVELQEWHKRWVSIIDEKTPACNKRGWNYTHQRLRSAYRSLTTNLPYLFTYQKYPELNIPNTTNFLDGMFSQLKNKLAVHRGLRRDRRFKMISAILGGREKTA